MDLNHCFPSSGILPLDDLLRGTDSNRRLLYRGVLSSIRPPRQEPDISKRRPVVRRVGALKDLKELLK